MRRDTIFSVCFLLTALLTFFAGCTRASKVVEQTKPIEQPAQVTPKPVEQQMQPQLPVKRGALVITSEPMGAEVYIDDNPMGTTPLALKDVPTGSYRLKMELEHYEIWRGDMDVKHQQTAEVRAKLEPKPGALEVKSEPSGAEVRIDGKEVGVTPYSGWVSADKEHTVFISAGGRRFESRKVTVRPEGREVVSVTLEEVKAGEMGAPTIIGKDGAEMVLIPAGEFLMGSPEGEGSDNEHPQHTVFLDAFYIDKYEVTNTQYKQFVDATGHREPKGGGYVNGVWKEEKWRVDFKPWSDENLKGDNQPVVCVSWEDAKAYCDWAGKRLPTEAEWEKAARGGLVGKEYSWGDSITHDDANYDGTDGKDRWEYTAPVGSFPPNGYGLYDMAGNVWEWCVDWYDSGYYAKSSNQNPTGPSSGSSRVLRSGGWLLGGAFDLRVARRDTHVPTDRYFSVGFRCAQDVTP